MITPEHQKEIQKHYGTDEVLTELEKQQIAEIAALKAKIERVRLILASTPKCCAPASVFAKSIKLALKALTQ